VLHEGREHHFMFLLWPVCREMVLIIHGFASDVAALRVSMFLDCDWTIVVTRGESQQLNVYLQSKKNSFTTSVTNFHWLLNEKHTYELMLFPHVLRQT